MTAFDGSMHQPPNPVDLQRHPPRDQRCAHFRSWMRDYADGELAPDQVAAIEQHVHDCRDCALAMSRAEHEVLRLRRALPPGLQQPRPNFARRTVQRLVRDLEQSPEVDAPLVALPKPDSTARPVASVANRAAAATHGWSVSARLTVALAALAAGLLLVFGFLLQGVGRDEAAASVVVLRGDGVWQRLEGLTRRQELRAGAIVSGQAQIDVGEGGHLEAALHDARGETKAVVKADGGSSLVANQDQLSVGKGDIELSTEQPTRVTLPDGQLVELPGRGRYHFSVTDYRGHHDALGSGPEFVVRVEVVDGDAARLLAARKAGAGDAELKVAAGESALWRGRTFVGVEPSVPQPTLGRPDPARTPAPLPPLLRLQVLEEGTRRPIQDAEVSLWYVANGAEVQQHPVPLAADGTFTLTSSAHLDSPYVVVQAVPRDRTLGMLPPTVLLRPETASTPVQVVLARTEVVTGTVVEAETAGVPIENVRVVPMLVDALSGAAYALPGSFDAVTNGRGGFELHGLPARLPPHLQLGVALLHRDFTARWVALPQLPGNSATALSWSLARKHTYRLQLSNLPPRTHIEVREGLVGLAPAAAASRLSYEIESGRVEVAAGQGPLWLGLSTNGTTTWSRLQVRARNGSQEAELERLPGVDLAPFPTPLRAFEGSNFLLASAESWPDRQLQTGAVRDVTLKAAAANASVPVTMLPLRTRLYVRTSATGNGSFALAGICDETGRGLAFLPPNESSELIAVGDDGSVGSAAVGGGRIEIELHATGGFDLSPQFVQRRGEYGLVNLQLRVLSGPAATIGYEIARIAQAPTWSVVGLPAGRYRVSAAGGETFEVDVAPGSLSRGR